MKIKTSLFYSLAAATLLSGVANAQTATDPVGFHTLKVFGADINKVVAAIRKSTPVGLDLWTLMDLAQCGSEDCRTNSHCS